MKKYLPIAICLLSLLLSSPVLAETKTFIKEYTYQASEFDSKASSRTLALEQVKRLLLEELGTYLESETEVKNFQLAKDQIITLTAGIVTAEIIDEKWDGKTYSLKAKITADPKDVANSIEKLHRDRQKTKELEEIKKKAEEALKEIEKLKKELEISKAGKAEQDQYRKAVNGLSAIDWVEKGYTLGIAGKKQEAVEAFTKAIQLDPKFVEAYDNRADAYYELGDYRQAIKDYDRAIELNPKDARGYFLRRLTYKRLEDYKRAIRDCDRAIHLTKGAKAYYYHLRGMAYAGLENYRQAVKDYDRAIQLDPKHGWVYYLRGVAYGELGDYRQAIDDYKIAAKLGDSRAKDYLSSKGISW